MTTKTPNPENFDEGMTRVAETSLDNDAPEIGDGCGRMVFNLPSKHPTPVNTLLSYKREVAGGLDSPLFPSSHSYNKPKSQEVKQNGNT